MDLHLKMLCVENEAELRKSLEQQFTDEGFNVDTAEDGDIGLELIKNKHYDIILLDIKMPRMDGLTVLKEMRKLDRHPHIVMLSVVEELQTVRECMELGAEDYVTKPYDPEDLLDVVIRTLRLK